MKYLCPGKHDLRKKEKEDKKNLGYCFYIIVDKKKIQNILGFQTLH